MSEWSQTFTFYEGRWIEGNPPILGPRDHAFWLASSVFDGARAFEGVAPDLDRHCARVNHSAKSMWLKPTMTAEAIEQLAWDGIKKFAPERNSISGRCTGPSATVRARCRPIPSRPSFC